jgi:RNA ligase (TIGR02306 family)
MLDSTRLLASLATIHDLRPIPDADAIEVGSVRSWDVVVRKGEFHDGDPVLYVEPDAALPLEDPRFAFLAQRGEKTIDGRKYHVLKTARLRGQLSQGIVFPAAEFPDISTENDRSLDEQLGIKLWEPPMPPVGAGMVGPWDQRWLRKTDAERVQNLPDEWFAAADDGLWSASEKIDGSSLTYVLERDGRLRVYSRNWELDTANPQATPIRLARELALANWMRDNKVDALQGELYGEGINGNRLRAKGQRLALFAAWRRSDGGLAEDCFDQISASALEAELELAPPIPELGFPTDGHQALALADGLKSVANPEVLAEGIVWRHSGYRYFAELDGRLVFKAVSPAYLLKHKL